MILEFLSEKIEYPITVYRDNEGAIYLVYNGKISNRTKHVDTRISYDKHTSKFMIVNSAEKGRLLKCKHVLS